MDCTRPSHRGYAADASSPHLPGHRRSSAPPAPGTQETPDDPRHAGRQCRAAAEKPESRLFSWISPGIDLPSPEMLRNQPRNCSILTIFSADVFIGPAKSTFRTE